VLVKQLPAKMFLVFDQLAVVCKPVPAVHVPCGAVHHHWEKDQDYDFAVVYNVDL